MHQVGPVAGVYSTACCDSASPQRELLEKVDCGVSDGRAGAKDALGAGRSARTAGRDDAADHHQMRGAPAPRAAPAPASDGPAARDETPTTCTSFSTACRAASSGVWNSGPISTSKPRSVGLRPRSWPSWPILATRMRGLRPCSCSNEFVDERFDGVRLPSMRPISAL